MSTIGRFAVAMYLCHQNSGWFRPHSIFLLLGVSTASSSLLLDPTGLASTLASEVAEKPQEVDESFPLARPACGVPGVSAAVPNDSFRWVREWSAMKLPIDDWFAPKDDGELLFSYLPTEFPSFRRRKGEREEAIDDASGSVSAGYDPWEGFSFSAC
jgi:hypothetical protein